MLAATFVCNSCKIKFQVIGISTRNDMPIKDNVVSKSTTKAIFDQIKKETEIFGWKSKTRSKKRMGIIIYDILTET